MADVLEVLYAICIARGYSIEELNSVRAKQAEKRGAYVIWSIYAEKERTWELD